MWDKRVRLTLRRMFETTIGDGTQEFTLEQEVAETSRVNSDVAALLVGTTRDGQITLLLFIAIGVSGRGSGGWRGRRLKLLVGVIDQILLVRHFGELSEMEKLVGVRVGCSASFLLGSKKVKKQRGVRSRDQKLRKMGKLQRIRQVCLGFKGGQDGVDVEVNGEEWGRCGCEGLESAIGSDWSHMIIAEPHWD